ncbi:MAG: TetR/AcrR family transcriptional regulator [Dehalococcoidia bacterium]
MTKIRDRDQLVEAAARVFARKGFDSASMEDIAAEVGVLQGSLYYHVSSKAELLFLVQHRRLMAINAALDEIADSAEPPAEKLRHAIGEHLHYLETNYPESRNWFTEPGRGTDNGDARDDIRELNHRYGGIWVRIIREGIESGAFRAGVDPGTVARGILGMCNWVPRWYRREGARSIDEIIADLSEMAVRGLLP